MLSKYGLRNSWVRVARISSKASRSMARLVQGGSRGANEYAGWGAYTRDELALPNRRGAVGISTRGRDTGDGQLYIDVADLFDLDHDYTVFGEVVAGMELVDRMQEGARIKRVRLTR